MYVCQISFRLGFGKSNIQINNKINLICSIMVCCSFFRSHSLRADSYRGMSENIEFSESANERKQFERADQPDFVDSKNSSS